MGRVGVRARVGVRFRVKVGVSVGSGLGLELFVVKVRVRGHHRVTAWLSCGVSIVIEVATETTQHADTETGGMAQKHNQRDTTTITNNKQNKTNNKSVLCIGYRCSTQVEVAT